MKIIANAFTVNLSQEFVENLEIVEILVAFSLLP